MKIGILGSGQLARMLILAGKPLGMDFVVFTPQLSATTEHLSDHVIAALDDQQALQRFVEQAEVITYETENIPVETVSYLNQQKPVFPGEEALAITQDRLQEKQLFRRLAVPTNDFYAVDSISELHEAVKILGFPLMLKSRRNGYDGKYHYRLNDSDDIKSFLKKESVLSDLIAEKFVEFDREISVLAIADCEDNLAFYDICENQHRDGILHKTRNFPEDPLSELAFSYVKKIIGALRCYVGVIAVEFFVQGEKLLANEIAPRVHNSGHWTIDACYSSQFENHLRAITGLPLGSTQSFARCEMTNIISAWPDRDALWRQSNLAVHDYQKTAREGRKLGHVTFVKG